MVTFIYCIKILLTVHQSSWFCSLQGNFKTIGIGSAQSSRGIVKTIKSGNKSSLGNEISEKQSIFYTSEYFEEARIRKTLYHTYIKDGSHSDSCNDEDHAFDYQLDQWGVEKLFLNSNEAITRYLKLYIEYWDKLNIKTNQVSKSIFLDQYSSLDLYDEDLKKYL